MATSKKNHSPKAPGNEFAAFVCEASATEALVPILAERGWSLESVSMGGIENAIRSLGASPSPQFLLVDLSDSIDPKGDMNALAEVCEPGTSVIAIGTLNDVGFYRELIDTGVIDYFIKPVSPNDIRAAIEQAEHLVAAPQETAPTTEAVSHRSVAVIGSRGGSGSSMIASTLAWITAHQLGKSTALLDLDIHFGTSALVFDLEPARGLVDALDNPGRVDSLFVERAVIKESENLAILSAEASVSEPIHADPAAMTHLIEELRAKYQTLVIDLPRYVAAQYPFIIGETTDVIIATDLSLAATRDTIRLLNFIKEAAPSARIYIAINGLGHNGPVEVDHKDFEASIERKIDWLIPFDPKSVVASAKQAKFIAQAAPGSKVVAKLREVAEAVVGAPEEAKSVSVWSRLMGKGQK